MIEIPANALFLDFGFFAGDPETLVMLKCTMFDKCSVCNRSSDLESVV